MNIKPQEIHIYVYDNSVSGLNLNDCLNVLSSDEKKEIEKLKFEKDKNVKGISRFLLRVLLSKYCQQEAGNFNFAKNSFGKIYLADGYSSNIKFNYSHSERLIVFAFALNDDIGIDIEKINPNIEHTEIAQINFSTKEVNYIKKAISQREFVEKFYWIWTRKEALLKALGKGLIEDLKSVEVINDEVITNLNNETDNRSDKFTITDLYITPFYKSAVAYSGSKREIVIKYLKERDIAL